MHHDPHSEYPLTSLARSGRRALATGLLLLGLSSAATPGPIVTDEYTITFDPIKDSYQRGETLTISGHVSTNAQNRVRVMLDTNQGGWLTPESCAASGFGQEDYLLSGQTFSCSVRVDGWLAPEYTRGTLVQEGPNGPGTRLQLPVVHNDWSDMPRRQSRVTVDISEPIDRLRLAAISDWEGDLGALQLSHASRAGSSDQAATSFHLQTDMYLVGDREKIPELAAQLGNPAAVGYLELQGWLGAQGFSDDALVERLVHPLYQISIQGEKFNESSNWFETPQQGLQALLRGEGTQHLPVGYLRITVRVKGSFDNQLVSAPLGEGRIDMGVKASVHQLSPADITLATWEDPGTFELPRSRAEVKVGAGPCTGSSWEDCYIASSAVARNYDNRNVADSTITNQAYGIAAAASRPGNDQVGGVVQEKDARVHLRVPTGDFHVIKVSALTNLGENGPPVLLSSDGGRTWNVDVASLPENGFTLTGAVDYNNDGTIDQADADNSLAFMISVLWMYGPGHGEAIIPDHTFYFDRGF